MNRKILLFCVLTAPLFLFVVIAESVNYQDLDKAVRDKEQLQSQLIEKNKRLETGINVLSSPERIESLARAGLGLTTLTSQQSLKIRFGDQPSEMGKGP